MPIVQTMATGPLSDAVIVAVSRLLDDHEQRREPSHWSVGIEIERAGLSSVDPGKERTPIGKAKRVRQVLNWAIANDREAGERLVGGLTSTIRGSGGFRPGSPNYMGPDAITDARDAFRVEGWLLTEEGELGPILLNEDLFGTPDTSDALRFYVRRANLGVRDAALVTGTGKDLLEATAAHVLVRRWGSYPRDANLPALLGQAFTAIGLATTQTPVVPGEPAHCRAERAYYEMGCALNGLRNREGTGHGRPFLPTLTDAQASTAVRAMAAVAALLLVGADE